jgi:acyl carrier protein
MTPIRERVIKLISVCLEIPERNVRPESTWRDHGADSLDLVELVLALEDELEVRFEASELNSFTTVADLLDGVERRLRSS